MTAESGSTVRHPIRYPVALTVLLGLTLALVFGTVGGALMPLKDLVLPRLVFYNPHVLWLSPLSHALWAVPGALVLWVAHRAAPRVMSVRVVVFLMIGILSYAVLRVYLVEIAKWASALVSIGVAQRASAWRGFRDPARLLRILRIGTPAVAAAVATIALMVLAGPDVRERLAQRGRPVPDEAQPNVLLLILDTVRAMSMGLYGNPRPTTPNLDALAATGVTFDLAIAPAPWTLPSHASMFTGRDAHELNATWRVPFDGAHPMLAEVLRAAGYRTGAVVANQFNANSAMGLGRGFDRYVDFTPSWGELIRSAYPGRILLNEIRNRWFEQDFEFEDFYDRRTAAEVTDDLLDWIGQRRERPFFAFANYFDVHDPYAAPDSAMALIAAVPHRRSPVVRTLQAGQLQPASARRVESSNAALDRYEAAMRYLDGEVGRLLHRLDTSGQLDNTIVIVSSDHGEEFGEHGLRWHAHSVYLPSLHVPLVITWPGRIPAGVRVSREVSLRELAATVLELVRSGSASEQHADGGRTASGQDESRIPGPSLVRHWRRASPSPEASPVISSLDLDRDGVERWPGSRRLESVVLDRMHYIRNENGPEELYDLVADPFETRNLAADPTVRLAPYRNLLLAAATPLAGRAPPSAPSDAARHSGGSHDWLTSSSMDLLVKPGRPAVPPSIGPPLKPLRVQLLARGPDVVRSLTASLTR